jgi:predicted RND superfamily exporter protein
LISQFTLMYEMSLPRGLRLQNQLNINKRHGRVVVMLENTGATPVLKFNQRAEAWMEARFPETMQAQGTGMDILLGKVTQRNIRSMLMGAVLALVAVSLLLMLALRSVRQGILSLIPNLLPAGMGFGRWAWLKGETGLAVSVVGCMTPGIVVDDSVHFLTRYVRAKREPGQGTHAAVCSAFRTERVALVGTSVVLVANFAFIGTRAISIPTSACVSYRP